MTQTTFSALENAPRLRSWRPGLAWAGGLLALLGGILFLQAQHVLRNWWADFILLAALALFAGGGAAYRSADDRLRGLGRLLLGSGLVVLVVALMFLLGLDWGAWWPLMLVAPGFALFLNGFSAPQDEHFGLAGYIQLAWWLGGATMLLGLIFFLGSFGWLDLAALTDRFQWWGLVILIPAVGAFYNAVWVYRQENGRLSFAAQSLAALGLTGGAVALVTLLHLNWLVLTPLILIFIGLGLLVSSLLTSKQPSSR